MSKVLQYIILSLGLALALSACLPPAAEGPFNNYYVSVDGSDSEGDGSLAHPWAGVQYAIEQADYSDKPVQIHIGEGRFTENLHITQPVILRGAGATGYLDRDGTVIQWAEEPASNRDPAHTIEDAEVELYDMTFSVGRVRMDEGKLRLDNVWFDGLEGYYGLWLQDVSGFSITNSLFRTDFRYADLGLRLTGSSGEVRDTYFGILIDHPIDIWQGVDSKFSVLNMDHLVIEGSRLCYADGIRVIGSANVTVTNSSITRSHVDPDPQWSDEPPCQLLDEAPFGDGISAGIGFQGGTSGNTIATETLQGNTISGFDMGIAFAISRMQVKAENNDISGLIHDTVVWFWPGREHPTNGAVIDFGGGRLGSEGGNIFRNANEMAARLYEGYDISACYNEWEVPNDQIDPLRIHDQLDDPALGRVVWSCEEEAQEQQAEPSAPQLKLDMDANCRLGDSTVYKAVASYAEGTQLPIAGRNAAGSWYWVEQPEGGHCWVAGSTGSTSGDAEGAQVVTPPPVAVTPTATATKEPRPSATATYYYDQNQNLVCP